ncbi:5-oxoprolinase subunit B family protein [Parvularcula marina]|uniref:Allophanate hydrolase subunit 1 n=1 Tax=Parvularcula marina TaxID=2292771 RepID=A0A371RJ67_9PROT|nr:allophanate hydrolase subunit 1 [Parvularcula marina]RFB05485.1 allophanate hydrolase subunit 1 [Parvularcula marina]
MMRARMIGDDLAELAVEDGGAAQAVADLLRESGSFEEIVPTMRKVAVQFDPLSIEAEDVLTLLTNAKRNAVEGASGEAKTLVVPVHYGGKDGPDIELVAASAGLSVAEFIELHGAREYPVEMMGFTPGFAYLGGLDDRVTAGRLETPRPHVPAGSVGTIKGFSCIYALAGPGGWPIIGRTDFPLFDLDKEDPFRLVPGMKIRFEAAQ